MFLGLLGSNLGFLFAAFSWFSGIVALFYRFVGLLRCGVVAWSGYFDEFCHIECEAMRDGGNYTYQCPISVIYMQ